MTQESCAPPRADRQDLAWDSVNQDCCGQCGMSGLELLQAGIGHYRDHICDPARAASYQKDRAWNLWRWQAGEMR